MKYPWILVVPPQTIFAAMIRLRPWLESHCTWHLVDPIWSAESETCLPKREIPKVVPLRSFTELYWLSLPVTIALCPNLSLIMIVDACLPSQGRRYISPYNLVRRLAVCQTRDESVGKRLELLLIILRFNDPGLPIQRSISPFFNLTYRIRQLVEVESIIVAVTYLHFAGSTGALNQLYSLSLILFDKLKERREKMLSVPSDPELCGHFDLTARLKLNRSVLYW